MTAKRTVRLVTVAALLALPQCWAPAAQAISPPPIDDRWLPEPAGPAPPQPTVQREVCTLPSTSVGLSQAEMPAQLAHLGLQQVWPLTRGAGQRVAVIDTGVSPHRRLPKLAAGGDYVFTGDGTQDCDGPGTAVAGIIAGAADPDVDGFSGVAPEATVLSIRQSSAKFGLATDPSHTGVGDVDTMARAVRTAADLGASVINISTVACVAVRPASTWAQTLDDRTLGAALAYAVDTKNAVVVAAAGNTGGTGQCPAQRPQATWDTVTVAVSPAWYDDYVLTVGSINPQGAPSAFTLAGPWVDVAAPGEAVTSLSTDGEALVNTLGSPDDAQALQGTSYAAPVVSGLAALIRARFPTMTGRQVMQRIKATAQRPSGGWNPLVGNGIVDAVAAVSTDAGPPTAEATPTGTPMPIATAPAPPQMDPRARSTALTGAALCLAGLVLALAIGAATRRLPRSATIRAQTSPNRLSGNDVPGD